MSCSSLNRDNEARAVAVDAELAHQRLGAVVPRAHADAELVQHLGQVVRVDVPVGEGDARHPGRRRPEARRSRQSLAQLLVQAGRGRSW